MKREVDNVGDGVDGEAREGLGERRRQALAMGLLVLLPADCVNFPEVRITEGMGRKLVELVEQVQVQPRAGSKKVRVDAAADGIQDIADQMADGHNPDYFISEEEEEAALDNLTATRYVEVCVYDFAIPEFQRYGMRGDAYELIDEGWGKFTPCKGSASFSIFLEKMSGNPKFGIL